VNLVLLLLLAVRSGDWPLRHYMSYVRLIRACAQLTNTEVDTCSQHVAFVLSLNHHKLSTAICQDGYSKN
jgi:hypothetical protein